MTHILRDFNWQILDLSKLKEFADNNFKFDENGGKFSKREGNIVGEVEIARYEQFFLFLWYFQKTCTTDTLKEGLRLWITLWEKEKMLVSSIFSFSHSVFYSIIEKSSY